MNARRNNEPPNRSKRLVRLGQALAVISLGLFVWQHAGNPPPIARQGRSAAVEDHSESRVTGQNPATQPKGERGLSPATAKRKQQLENLWAAFLAAQAMEDPTEQTAAMNRLLEGMPQIDAASLLDSLRPQDLQSLSARRLFDHWATASPQEAATWAQALIDPNTSLSFMLLAAQRWANADLNQAVAWARSLPLGDSRLEIMTSVASEAVRTAPQEALCLGVELPAGAKQANLLRRAAAEWAVTDRDSALEWARQIENNDLRQLVTAQVVAASANQDPALAATIALREMNSGTGQDRALVTIIGHWVQTDPEGASAWVSQFPDGQLGQDAMENLVNLWAGQDLVASGNWLLTLPSSELQMSGVLAYACVLKRSDPELARRWMSSVMDPNLR